ncbi:MAG: CDP-alcohol phosphatidyltransferase family protein, partial [Candidatus Limnocylindrales bacterium]
MTRTPPSPSPVSSSGPAPSPSPAASQGFRQRVRNLGEPVALFFGRLGLTPNGLTVIGFLITVAGAALAAANLWLAAGLIVFAGGAFDLFDGALARASGTASNLGAFFDSVFDRWGEG